MADAEATDTPGTRPPASVGSTASWFLVGNVGYVGLMGALVLLLPRWLPAHDYAVWQLYMFFAMYLGYVSFGINEGLYLRFGGQSPDRLPRQVIGGQLKVLSTLLVGLALVLSAVTWLAVTDPTYRTVLWAALVATVFFVGRTFYSAVFQATGMARNQAAAMLSERVVLVVLSLGLLVAGVHHFLPYVLADVVAKIIGLVVAATRRPRFVELRQTPLTDAFAETRAMGWGGTFLLVSNILAVAAPGLARLSAERTFGLLVFSSFSLALVIANMFQTVLASLSVTLFPSVKRLPESQLPATLRRYTHRLAPPVIVGLLSYFAIAWFARLWLPDYDSLPVLIAALLPSVVFDARFRVITMVFLNALRKERLVTVLSVLSIALMGVLVVVFCLWRPSIVGLAVSVTVVTACKSLVGSIVVQRALGIRATVPVVLELVASAAFLALVLTGGLTRSWLAVCVVIGCAGLALVVDRRGRLSSSES